jgi:hypothetical protein
MSSIDLTHTQMIIMIWRQQAGGEMYGERECTISSKRGRNERLVKERESFSAHMPSEKRYVDGKGEIDEGERTLNHTRTSTRDRANRELPSL